MMYIIEKASCEVVSILEGKNIKQLTVDALKKYPLKTHIHVLEVKHLDGIPLECLKRLYKSITNEEPIGATKSVAATLVFAAMREFGWKMVTNQSPGAKAKTETARTVKATEEAKVKEESKAERAKASGRRPKTTKSNEVAGTDTFGFRNGTGNSKFGKMLLLKNGCTMKEVKETVGGTFYNAFANLEQRGLAKKDKDGRMFATAKVKA